MLPLIIIFSIAVLVFILERLFPGRILPYSQGWYLRAIVLNLCQLGLVVLAGVTWSLWLRKVSVFQNIWSLPPILEGFVYWVLGTFVFYWWHRLRHQPGWWRLFHQVHHSPVRVELLTSFYKHPLEAATNSLIISIFIYGIFGAGVETALWYNVFAIAAEFFYHMNVRTPIWIGYLIQRPEHHSIHHERGVHRYNFGDLTLWDRLFGTFKDTKNFVTPCGFAEHREERFKDLLICKDVQRDHSALRKT